MSNKKLQVFVSSTFTDLIDERQAAVQAILKAGHIPAGMELFKAGDEEQMKVIERWIDESDVYMLILGGRYGSVDEKTAKSYTQLEYEYALKQGKALFAVVVNQPVLDSWLKEFGYEKIEKYYTKELEQFRAEVMKGKVVAFWDDAKDIKLAIVDALSEFMYRDHLIGWVRGDNAINTGVVAEEMARLGKENDELKKRLSDQNTMLLYAGLPYAQLKNLLEQKVSKLNNVDISAYDFIIEYGNEIGMSFNIDTLFRSGKIKENIDNRRELQQIIRILSSYKMIDSPQAGAFKMSEDGHRFYLKSLALQNE